MFMHAVEPGATANKTFRYKIFRPLRLAESLRLTRAVLYRRECLYQDSKVWTYKPSTQLSPSSTANTTDMLDRQAGRIIQFLT